MEQKVVAQEKLYPQREANRITKLLDIGLNGNDRYPVDIRKVALELTPAFSADPITKVEGNSFSSIDGALVRHPNQREWGILYNENITHPGRFNFTLAHELGHYMVHRHRLSSGRIECGNRDMLSENNRDTDIEQEANVFAASLLMPNHDFRTQADGQLFSFDLMTHCADRYGVSLTAAVLKWLDFTKHRAVAILSEDGGMHWAKSSDKAFRSGRYFPTRQQYCEVPPESAAAQEQYSFEARDGVRHAPGVWFEEEVTEHSIVSQEHSKTLTVLILDKLDGYCDPVDFNEDSERLIDSATNFRKNGQTAY